MFGKITKPENEKLQDLSAREITILVPMVIIIFLMGIYPKLFFSKMDVSVEKFLKDFKGRVEMKADLSSPKIIAEIKNRVQGVKDSSDQGN